jgi:outer membrane lipoprotein-sorting protein
MLLFSIAPTHAADPLNMVDAMKQSGFSFDSAQWTSNTTQDDGSGNVKKSNQKFWISGRQMRIETLDEESGETFVILDDGNQQYLYNPKENTAMVMNEMMKGMYSGLLNSEAFKQGAENRKNAKTTGSETINGKPCTIKEYENNVMNITSQVKEWVWDAKQFPMKSIVTVPGQTITMMGQSIKMPGSKTESVVTEVSLDQPIDASLFKLPAGVKVESMGNPMDSSGMDDEE